MVIDFQIVAQPEDQDGLGLVNPFESYMGLSKSDGGHGLSLIDLRLLTGASSQFPPVAERAIRQCDAHSKIRADVGRLSRDDVDSDRPENGASHQFFKRCRAMRTLDHSCLHH